MSVSFRLNGQEITAEVDPNSSLMTYVREVQGLTGTKDGCSIPFFSDDS